jgi:predicted nucleic-acid-binding protein
VVIRLLTQDDAKQAAIANSIFATEEVWIANTVLLETNWVLEKVYRFPPNAIRHALMLLISLPNVRLQDEEAALNAIEWLEDGLDFADALHLANRPAGARFVSFDKTFVDRARRAGIKDIGLR